MQIVNDHQVAVLMPQRQSTFPLDIGRPKI